MGTINLTIMIHLTSPLPPREPLDHLNPALPAWVTESKTEGVLNHFQQGSALVRISVVIMSSIGQFASEISLRSAISRDEMVASGDMFRAGMTIVGLNEPKGGLVTALE